MSIAYGGQKVTFADGSSISSGYTGFKNRIINGAMVIDQRNAGGSVTLSGDNTYDVDRWAGWGGGGTGGASKFTMQQNAGSITPPTGFINYCGITSASAYTVQAGDYYAFSQQIEGLNIGIIQEGIKRTPLILRGNSNTANFENLQITLPNGGHVPITTVAKLAMG